MFLLTPSAFPWDMAITILLAGSFGVGIAALVRIFLARTFIRRFGIAIVGLLAASAFSLVAYGSFVEPGLVTVMRGTVALGTRHPLKIAVISDLHVGPYVRQPFVSDIVRTINGLSPDIVLIPGDFVQLDEVDADTLALLRPLQDVRATYGVFAVFGNHDHGVYRSLVGLHHTKEDPSELIGDFISRLGITMLTNASVTIPLRDSGSLTIAGIDDAWSGNADLLAALRDRKVGNPVILLSHNPDVISDPLSEEAALIVSGHTHGGQIRLPWIGPLSSLPTRIGRMFDEGIFPLSQGNTLVITRGIGELGPRARLFAPPEVMLLTTKDSR